MKEKWKKDFKNYKVRDLAQRRLESPREIEEFHEKLVVISNQENVYFGEIIVENEKVYVLSDDPHGSGEPPEHRDIDFWRYGCYIIENGMFIRQEEVYAISEEFFKNNEGLVEVELKGKIYKFLLTPSQAEGVVGILNRLVGDGGVEG